MNVIHLDVEKTISDFIVRFSFSSLWLNIVQSIEMCHFPAEMETC